MAVTPKEPAYRLAGDKRKTINLPAGRQAKKPIA